MNKIRLDHFDYPDPKSVHSKKKKFLSIALPNGKIEYFASKRAAKQRLSDINRVLNVQAHDLNHLVGGVYVEFRFYFFNLSTTEISYISRYFENIDKAIRLMFTKYYVGPGFVFQRFTVITTSLTDIIEVLEKLPMNAAIGPMRYRLRALSNRLQYIQSQLEEITGPPPI